MDISILIGESIGAALFTGTFLFYVIKGFFDPKANWFYIFLGTFVVFFTLFEVSHPNSPLTNPLMGLINLSLIVGGIVGAIKYYRKAKKNIVTEEKIHD